MRVLVVQPTADKRGHYGLWTTRLCQAMGEAGHEVTLCTNACEPRAYVADEPRFRLVEVAGGRYAFGRFDEAYAARPLTYYRGYFRNSAAIPLAAFRLCRAEPFDAIFLTDAEFLTVAVLLHAVRGELPPILMQVNAANFSYAAYDGSLAHKAYKTAQREVLRTVLGRRIRALAVLGEWHRERLRAQLRLPTEFPIEVVPDAADVSVPEVAQADARRRLRIDYTGPLLLFFGILREDKGLGTLLQAVARLPNQEFRLLVAGAEADWSASRILAEAERLGVADKLVLRVGYVPEQDVSAHFFASDALVLPYTRGYTGGSGPLMKGACTYRRPLIASDVAEMGRLVNSHALGLTAAPEDPGDLARAIREFLLLPNAQRETMRLNACELGHLNSWDAIADRLVQVLAVIASSPGR